MSIILILFISSCKNPTSSFERILPSPDAKKHLYFNLNNGEPYYLLYYENHILIDWSMLGFVFDETIKLNEGLLVENVETRTSRQNAEDNFPEIESNLDVYNEMTIFLSKEDNTDLQLSIVLRIYNNAVAFKYEFNFSGGKRNIIETTELDLYNNFFQKVVVKDSIHEDLAISEIPVEEVDTLSLPATFISKEFLRIDYLESFSSDYPSMQLVRRTPSQSEFQMRYTNSNSLEIEVNSGFETPWRIIYVTNNLN